MKSWDSKKIPESKIIKDYVFIYTAINILPETVFTRSSRSGTNPCASVCLQPGSTDAADVSFRRFIAMYSVRECVERGK